MYYKNFADTRACSPRTCAADGCTYNWRVYNQADAMCASPLLQLSAVDQCAQINPQQGKLRLGVEIKGAGACAAAGGESTGGVTADQPITMCCDG
jgi:hypothetical protein